MCPRKKTQKIKICHFYDHFSKSSQVKNSEQPKTYLLKTESRNRLVVLFIPQFSLFRGRINADILELFKQSLDWLFTFI